MALSHELISQFAKVVNNDKKQNIESTIYGTVVDQHGHQPGDVDANGNKIVIDETGGKYIKPDGSDQLIPITENSDDIVQGSTTTNTNYGDRATVLIKDHTATVTGNISSPATNNKEVETKISEFDIAVGDQLQANKGYFKELIADKANIGNLAAAIIGVAELLADDATIDNLIANKAKITNLIADKIDADVVIADEAIIEHLKAATVDVLSLIADKAVIEELIANNVDINSLEAKNAYLKYANIDFANIGEAAINNFYAKSGVIQDIVISEGHITGRLVGVTISGDLIEGNTVKADKLVVLGEDGLYYKLNIDAGAVATEQVSEDDLQNGLSGDVIIANTITAEKINVNDLVAFDATIGGFNITDTSIYSEVKDYMGNTTRGIYMDTEGRLNFGDANNYIKYYKDENGYFKLAISADSILYNFNGKSWSLADFKPLTESIAIGEYEGEPCIILGEHDSDFRLLITNTRILFTAGSTVPAYITNQALNIDKAIIENELQIGAEDNNDGVWVWKKRANGNLGLMWKG